MADNHKSERLAKAIARFVEDNICLFYEDEKSYVVNKLIDIIEKQEK